MMKRWRVHLLIACGLFAAALTANAQSPPKVWRIGWLGLDSSMQTTRLLAFKDGLWQLRYVEGKNVTIEYRWAEGRFDRLPELAAELVASHVDVIVTASPPGVRAAQGATRGIPIVMIVHEPVLMGFVQSLARPGGNITGLAFQDTDLSNKRLDLFRQAVPRLSRLAILWNATATDAKELQIVEDTAKAMGLQVLSLEIREPRDFATAMAAAKSWGAQGMLPMAAPFITKHRQVLLDLLRTYNLPATCEFKLYVEEGCLMTYSANLDAMFQRLAYYVDRVLKGANPGDLAIEQPREFEFVINLKTARALGLVIPSLLRLQATEVIQ